MDHVSVPSPEQLALALAIVKHKPIELSIEDYILQTRQLIKTWKESDRDYSQEKFFDSVSFWKQAYEKSEAEQSKLLDRIYELEQRNETLLGKVQARDISLKEPDQGTSKRKPVRKNVTRNSTMRKRAKTQVSSTTSPTLVGLQAGAHNIGDIEHPEDPTAPFMRHFYVLQKVLQKRPNNQSIIQAVVNLCKKLEEELLNVFPENRPASRKNKKGFPTLDNQLNFQQALRSTECTVNLLFQALRRLSGTGSAVRDANLAIYHVVYLYEMLMDVLERYCKVKAEQNLLVSKPKAKSSKHRQTTKLKGALPSNLAEDPSKIMDEGAKQIAGLLTQMIGMLELSFTGHQNLLEGFLFLLLRRIGKLLCLFVFQDLQLRPDLQIDPARLSLPEGMVNAVLDVSSLCAAQMEAKNLISPLDRAMVVLETFPSLPNPSSSTTTTGEELKSMEFISNIKAKLQGTLLQAVFGGDSAWGDPLLCPVRIDDREVSRFCNYDQLPELSVPEWFIQEVWRLLGWEILMKESVFKQ